MNSNVDLHNCLQDISNLLLNIKTASSHEVLVFSSVPSLAHYLYKTDVLDINDYLLIRGIISETNNNLLNSTAFEIANRLVIEKLNDILSEYELSSQTNVRGED